jgi:asparagine synthetase B (glutamine-hydrolysing)
MVRHCIGIIKGADEVFGGYARYKTAMEKGGEQTMMEEMGMDLDRLWHRNFGRDDRCISANGKECRYPFIDQKVLELAGLIPIRFICDFKDYRGKGDKKILRNIAQSIGLE